MCCVVFEDNVLKCLFAFVLLLFVFVSFVNDMDINQVAEFGGTLGLFIGFNFMSFWDAAVSILSLGKAVCRKDSQLNKD